MFFFNLLTPWLVLESHSNVLNYSPSPFNLRPMSTGSYRELHDYTCQASDHESTQLIASGIGQSIDFCNVIKWGHIFSLLGDWKVSSCGQIHSCKFWFKFKKGFRISKRVSPDRFLKRCPFNNLFLPFRN